MKSWVWVVAVGCAVGLSGACSKDKINDGGSPARTDNDSGDSDGGDDDVIETDDDNPPTDFDFGEIVLADCEAVEAKLTECGKQDLLEFRPCAGLDGYVSQCEAGCVTQASCGNIVTDICSATSSIWVDDIVSLIMNQGTSSALLATCSSRCNSARPCADGVGSMETWQICNFENDCADGSDEAQCPEPFVCADGEAISPSWYCDGYGDCEDYSDEPIDCPNPEVFMCSEGQLIQQHRACDTIPDCPDGSDENENCPPKFRCEDGEIIDISWQCDGMEDCAAGEDEVECPEDAIFTCDDGEEIALNWQCDAYPDCTGGEDEDGCPQFACADGGFVSPDEECDGYYDCDDNSDEHSSCANFCDGDTYPLSWKCDGQDDCTDASDETECPPGFMCANGEEVDADAACNGWVQCADTSDEYVGCPSFEGFTCGSGEVINIEARCTGTVECTDGSDEEDNCFTCANGEIKDKAKVYCDRFNDCGDNSDEPADCPLTLLCAE